MVNEEEEAQDSEFADPLSSYYGLSLFPSAFPISPSKPRQPGTDIDDIHKHLKFMVSRSPTKLLEQAKTILEGNSNLMQSEIAKFDVTDEKKEDTTAKVEEHLQERRPALNRKRARFSLKPDVGQPTVNLEPTLDIKQLKDPEEFFSAYERLENAKREIQKQMGGVLKDLNQQNPSMNTRQRRPGILGRSVRYKHHYSSIPAENDENAVLSQVSFESGNVSPSIRGSEIGLSSPIIGTEKETDEDADFEEEEEEEEFVASITKAENKVNKILAELLSSNCEDLEGDQAISMLQDRLQIKPINLEKLCLPDLQGIQTINLKSTRGNLSKHSLMGNYLAQGIETMKFKQDTESSVRLLDTPTALKSPLASLSSLKMHILQSNSSSDPFSANDIAQSPTINHSLFESDDLSNIAKQGISESKSLLNEDDGIVTNKTSSPVVRTGDVDPLSEISSSDVLNIPQVGTDDTSSETHIDMENNDIGGSNTEAKMNEKFRNLEAQVHTLGNASDENMEEHEGLTSEQPDTSMVDAIEEHMVQTPSQLDQPNTTFRENPVDGLSRNDDGTKHHNKAKPKSRVNKRHADKNKSQRQSLAAAGTMWQSGVRRSTRIRTRPLQYWKGERLLYGRVHESLATVIGLKYESPAKGNGQPTLKVKSYVSDKYKELVELAALH